MKRRSPRWRECHPESGGGSVATASGMAATVLVGSLLRPGDHVVLVNDAYGGTFRYFARVLGEHGVEWSAVDLTYAAHLEGALRANTRLVWAETPTNPQFRVGDLAALPATRRAGGALVAGDNTFATPSLQHPLELGAPTVVHSTTKYLGGHSDVGGGAVVTADPDLIEQLRFLANATGPGRRVHSTPRPVLRGDQDVGGPDGSPWGATH